MTVFANLATARPGDTVSIQLFPAGRHEGIVGTDGYIISRSRRYAGVTSLPPSVFSDGKLRDNHGYIGMLSPEETVRRAEARIGEMGYDIIGHNCVHFVNEVNGLPPDARLSDNARRFASLSDIAASLPRRLW